MAAPYRICLLLMYSLIIQILEVLPSGRIAQQGCRFHLPPNTGLFCIPQARECSLCPQALLTCAAHSAFSFSCMWLFLLHIQAAITFTLSQNIHSQGQLLPQAILFSGQLCVQPLWSARGKTGAPKRLKPFFLRTDTSLPGIRRGYHMAQSLLSW